ncbi:MAG: hypothetical protein J6S71_10250 [Clostridia bacterium]|nr:hypothetical protein [Clostridia bacterium]
MKKLIALTLALLMLTMSFVACDKTEPETTTEPTDNQTEAPAGDTTAEETTEAVVELPYANALELINIVFNGYNATATEDTMLYVAGGNINNFDTCSMEGPAAFVALADEDYDQNLGIPASEAAKIESAASMFNMMNTNVFNCFTVQFKAGTDVDATINTIKENILGRQWICGSPEKLVIIKCPGDSILVIWGAVQFGGIVDPVAASVATLVEGATTVVEHNFAQ